MKNDLSAFSVACCLKLLKTIERALFQQDFLVCSIFQEITDLPERLIQPWPLHQFLLAHRDFDDFDLQGHLVVKKNLEPALFSFSFRLSVILQLKKM